MKLTGSDIRSRAFSRRKRGYDRLEVDAFLFAAAEQVDRLVRENEQLGLQCADLFEEYNRLKKEHAEARKTLASLPARRGFGRTPRGRRIVCAGKRPRCGRRGTIFSPIFARRCAPRREPWRRKAGARGWTSNASWASEAEPSSI